MKYIFVVILILGGGFYMFFGLKNKKISDIKSISYHYTTGTMMNADVRYEVECEGEKCLAKIKPNLVPDEEAMKYTVDKSVMDEIKDVLIKYHVERWDGFQKSDPNVLDGNSFSLYVSMADGNSISASGYMEWPNNYSEVSRELDKIFKSIN